MSAITTRKLVCSDPLFFVAIFAVCLVVQPASSQTAATWNGGAGNWSNSALWTPATTPNSAAADVFVDGAKTGIASSVSVDGLFTVGRLTIDAGDAVSIPDSRRLTVTNTGGFSGAGSIVNDGSLIITANTNFTDLSITGAGTLSGTGTLTMIRDPSFAGASNVRILGSGTFTNSSTIQGEAQIGNNQITLINSSGGIIQGNSPGRSINIDPGAGGMSNSGILRATAGGFLNLRGFGGGAFTNSATGIMEAQDASNFRLLESASIIGGTFQTFGTGVISIFAGQSATLNGVTNAGNFRVDDNTTLRLDGTLTNNGVISMNATSTNALLRLASNSTLAGTGVLTMSGSQSNQIYADSAGRILAIAAGATIQGGGLFNPGFQSTPPVNIVNHGLIDANSTGNQITIGLSNDGTANLTNDGILRASNGGTLLFHSFNVTSTIANSGGTLDALNNSSIRVSSGVTVEGGTITGSGTGAVRGAGPGAGGGRLSNVTNNGTIALADNEFLSLGGTITNNGLIRLDAAVSGATLRLANGTTLTGTGTLTLSDNPNNFVDGVNTSGVFTIAASAKVQGSGSINPGFSGGSQMAKITNQGVIEANNVANALNLRIEDFNTTPLTNTGTLRATNGATLNLSGTSTVTNSGGTIEALNNSFVRLGSGITVEGGVVTTTGTGTIRGAGPGGGGGRLSNVTNNGTVAIGNGEFLSLGGTFTNNGVLRLDAGTSGATLRMANNTTLIGNGPITLSDHASNVIEGVNTGDILTVAASAKIQGSGTINPGPSGGSRMARITNQGTIEANNAANALNIRMENFNNTALTNTGTLRASNGATLAFSGTHTLTNNGGTLQALASSTLSGTAGVSIIQSSGAIDLHGGNMNFAGGVTLNGGELLGTGTFTGPVTVNANATLQGGNGTTGTTLTVAGPLSLNDDSIIELALGPSGTHSTLARAGSGAWIFDSNQTFMFLDVGGQVGAYDNIITGLSANPGTTASWTITNPGWIGNFTYDGANIDLTLTAMPVPEPSTWAAALLMLIALIYFSRRHFLHLLRPRRER